MKLTLRTKETFVTATCLLYILLLVYAALSKLLDYNNFQVQLGQSPLLSAFAGWVSWSVPVSELVLSICLMIRGLRLAGLFGSYILMVLFSAYIYIMLNYSSYVPCSCGGILEKMGWSEHLVFNIFFVAIAAIALLIYPCTKSDLIHKQP